MSINLTKANVGQAINLKKTENRDNNLSHIIIGLGWDIARGQDYDLDACALLLQDGVLRSSSDIVSYQNKKHSSGQIWSTGDNLTGAGDGDDEQIIVKLDTIPTQYNKIVFYATIYSGRSRGQNFSGVKNAFIRAVDNNSNEMVRFDMSGDSSLKDKCSLVFAQVERTENGWEFTAINQAYDTDSLSRIADMYKSAGVSDITTNSTTTNSTTTNTQEQPRKKLFGLF